MQVRLILALLLVPGLAVASPISSDPKLPDPTTQILTPPPKLHGTFALAPKGSEPAVASISNLIYLHRCVGTDCMFTQGAISSSMANTTWLGGNGIGGGPSTGAAGTQYTIAPFGYSDQIWNDIVTCVKETYAPYDVTVTEVDPGTSTPHHEAVVGGTADDLGLDPLMVGGVGPLYPDCGLHDNTVSFTFANGFPGDALFLCGVVAQETAHGFGIEHSFNCADPMTYLDSCGLQFFRNVTLSCGEYTTRACICGGGQQNTHSKMLAVFGLNPTPLPAPDVTITIPADQSVVINHFAIAGGAVDHRGLSTIELWFNGYKWSETPATMGQDTYVLNAPTALPDGVIDVEVRAYNDLHTVMGSKKVTVTKGAPCTTADTCAVGQKCAAGKCSWDTPAGELGDLCDYPQFCVSGQCEAGECTKDCSPGVTGECPMGFECVDPGFCLTKEGGGGGGGCCSASDGTSAGAVAVQVGLAGLVLGGALRRRRKR